MSIFEAEHRNKYSSEDLLTSRIFGSLELMEKETVFGSFLKTLIAYTGDTDTNIKQLLETIESIDTNKLQLKLWQHCGRRDYGESYPDVFIEGLPDYFVVIEVKENSKATVEQIVRQCKSIYEENSNTNIVYFLLTKERTDIAKEAQKRLNNKVLGVYSIQWSQIWQWFTEIQNQTSLSITDKLLVKDLTLLLKDKGMATFTGFEKKWLDRTVVSSVEAINNLYSQLNYLGEYINQKGIEGITFKQLQIDTSFSRKLDPSISLVPHWIWLEYMDIAWNKRKRYALNCAFLYIGIDLNEANLVVGFSHEKIDAQWWQELSEQANKKGYEPNEIRTKKGKKEIAIEKVIYQAGTPSSLISANQGDFFINSLVEMRDFIRINL